ncbi:MAG TPA: hypothetical protein VFZ34_11830 [Blastocatellia bacterium]|nr:hypothetical protein [Blastocatellia bacterium]
MRKSTRWVFCWLVFLVSASWAQQAALTPKAPAKSEAPAKALLKIPVWVEKEDGAFWDEGKRQSFKVFLEDKEVAIKNFLPPKSSTVVLVVFDTVADLTRVDEARSALQDALKDLNEQYWIGLLRAQDGLSVLQEPTADHKLLNEKIQAIQVNGKAGLLDTLEPVAQMATAILQKAAVRLSVLYVTDSSIGHYRADYLNPVINASDAGDLSRRFSDRAVQERISRLSESLAGFTVPLFILHLEYRGDTMNLAYQSGLERLAANSGGAAILCRTTDEIRPGLTTLLNRLRASYVVTVDPPQTKRQVVKVRIEAQDATGTKLPRVTHINQVTRPKK